MGFFKFFDAPAPNPDEWHVITPQRVLVSDASGWTQRVLHKGEDGTLWVHGDSYGEWIELDPDGTVKEVNPHLQQRRWREMPTMLDQPFVTIRREA